ncbi:MAG: hypothetical protein ACKOUQ_05885, partial [Aquirufa sp.]
KYLEYRLFWPYSSGIPGQWMSHQIDTVHWFSGLSHPNSVVANGGIYQWNDGRVNADTMTVVFDYGKGNKGFQVQFTSRFSNSAGGTKEIYYSNGGELNLETFVSLAIIHDNSHRVCVFTSVVPLVDTAICDY